MQSRAYLCAFFLILSLFQAALAGGWVVEDDTVYLPSQRVFSADEDWPTCELDPYILDPTDALEIYELEVLNRHNSALFCPLGWYAPFYKELDRDGQDDFSIRPRHVPHNLSSLRRPIVSSCTLHGGNQPLSIRLIQIPQSVLRIKPITHMPTPVSLGFIRSPMSLNDIETWFHKHKPRRLFFQKCSLHAAHLDRLQELSLSPTHLRLRHNHTDDHRAWGSSLLSWMGASPDLSHIALDQVGLDETFLEEFADFFVQSNTLTHVRLRHHRPLSDDFLRKISTGLGEDRVMHTGDHRHDLVVRPLGDMIPLQRLASFARFYMRYASALL